MTDTILHARRALTLLALAGLAACGGGGGGGSGVDDPPVGADLLAITDANADAVARSGLASTGVGPLTANLGAGLGGTNAASRVVAQVGRRAQALGLQSVARVQPQAAEVLDCAVSGTVTVDFQDGNANSLFDVAGESLSITASACNEGDGVTLDGNFTMTLDSYTNGSNYGFTMAFNALRAQDTDGAVRLDGSLRVQLTGGTTLDMSASSIDLQATPNGASYRFVLADFSAHAVDRGDALVERISGRFSGSGLSSGSVSVTTPVDVVQRYADDYPSAGTMTFVGAKSSALRIEALSATQARLSIDADGDGTYETVRTVAWADLDR